MTTPEAKLKADIKAYLKTLPNIFFHSIPGGAYGKVGAPDIVVCYKGRYIGIEAKTYEGRFSDWQKTRKAQIENAMGTCIFARSVDDVRKVLEENNDTGEVIFEECHLGQRDIISR